MSFSRADQTTCFSNEVIIVRSVARLLLSIGNCALINNRWILQTVGKLAPRVYPHSLPCPFPHQKKNCQSHRSSSLESNLLQAVDLALNIKRMFVGVSEGVQHVEWSGVLCLAEWRENCTGVENHSLFIGRTCLGLPAKIATHVFTGASHIWRSDGRDCSSGRWGPATQRRSPGKLLTGPAWPILAPCCSVVL